MPQISEDRREYKNASGSGPTVVTIAPYAASQLPTDEGDLVGGQIKPIPAGGYTLYVANEGIQGLVVLSYDGNTIELMPGQFRNLKYKVDHTTKKTHYLKAATITVGANAKGTYIFSYPA